MSEKANALYVPDELQQATEQMQLGAEFSTHAFGFDR